MAIFWRVIMHSALLVYSEQNALSQSALEDEPHGQKSKLSVL